MHLYKIEWYAVKGVGIEFVIFKFKKKNRGRNAKKFNKKDKYNRGGEQKITINL